MNSIQKTSSLKDQIINLLTPIIDRDYYLLDLPYHPNIGDTLIWQGELDFLSELPYKCKGMHSLDTFRFPKLGQDIMILIHGGGNFGDIWERHHEIRLEKIRHHFYENKILFFPQTIWFNEEINLFKTSQILSECPNVVICARDNRSYQILRQYFKNQALLVPDMAFCINTHRWRVPPSNNETLYVKRIDKELSKDTPSIPSFVENVTKTSDWPTFYKKDFYTRLLKRMLRHPHRLGHIIDFYCYHYYRKYLINKGIEFLADSRHIYATRLHAAILGILMNREVTLLDNSYGKLSTFYDTWLSDLDSADFMHTWPN